MFGHLPFWKFGPPGQFLSEPSSQPQWPSLAILAMPSDANPYQIARERSEAISRVLADERKEKSFI